MSVTARAPRVPEPTLAADETCRSCGHPGSLHQTVLDRMVEQRTGSMTGIRCLGFSRRGMKCQCRAVVAGEA